MHASWRDHEFEVSTDPARIDAGIVHRFLTTSYWAAGIPIEVVERALRHSLCFALFAGAEQIGLARVVTDRATFAYLCDVHVLEAWRGRGLGRWLMRCVWSHPDLQGLRRCGLVTRDAHMLYAPSGFTALAHPDRHMEKLDPDVYKRAATRGESG